MSGEIENGLGQLTTMRLHLQRRCEVPRRRAGGPGWCRWSRCRPHPPAPTARVTLEIRLFVGGAADIRETIISADASMRLHT